MEKIKLVPTDLKYQRPISVEEFSLTLCDTYFRFVFKMVCSEPKDKDDELTVWEECTNDFDIRCRKDQVVCVQMEWSDWNERWKLTIMVNGVADDLRCFFKSKKRCTDIFNQVGKWWLGEEWIIEQ